MTTEKQFLLQFLNVFEIQLVRVKSRKMASVIPKMMSIAKWILIVSGSMINSAFLRGSDFARSTTMQFEMCCLFQSEMPIVKMKLMKKQKRFLILKAFPKYSWIVSILL